MRILIRHAHGSFVRGAHGCVPPPVPGRGPDGRERAVTFDRPRRAREAPWGRLPASL
ncbi:hypothetical protein [Nonomuraea insulae]|uniref:Uncharacterized protein n=1 Tax=Nonomuraea insulae TaxID=1616787 RepID=A0ABW1CUP4_9ACTN